MTARVGFDVGHGPWSGRIELDHAARQDRVAADDTPTPSYTLVNLSLSRKFELAGSAGLWFVQVHNACDKLAYNASSIQTVRDLAPLPGRSLAVGLRVHF